MNKRLHIFILYTFFFVGALAQNDSISTKERQLADVVVTASKGTKARFRIENTENIGQQLLIRAACCNLGESFVSNPSVDVSYSDAATGAKQIKLLGLSGTYVQMMTENMPNLRGGSMPYALGYTPGPWMQSIQVSKGASSVKNGYESITGQINIEYLKPQATDGIRGNAYVDSQLKYELNADGSIHLTDKLSTSILMHYENRQRAHDGNGDGFMDMPKQRQWNVMHRWAYVSPLWISQLSMRVLRDERISGQHADHYIPDMPAYTTDVTTNRYEAQWKNGFTLNADRNASIALMLQGSWHDAHNRFGMTRYDFTQKTFYAQLMYETDIDELSNIALGASLNHDYYKENTSLSIKSTPKETTPGAYAQYTLKLHDVFTAMAGIRADHSSIYGTFVTPRLHLKYSPTEILTIRASAGKGYRTPHALADNTPMLASGRAIAITDNLRQEEAWNYGISASFNIPVAGKTLELNAEYYYTHFLQQMVINVDGEGEPYCTLFSDLYSKSGAHSILFSNLDGKSYSHTLQVDATYPFFEGFSTTAAFRYNDARTTYDGILRQRPLTSRFKGLLTLSYKTPLELWHFDVTGQLNGHGRLYDHTSYPTYFQLQAQITREFRNFSLYIGGENLTNYRISEPIRNAHNPWNPAFDATQIWGPTDGAMAYVGIRCKL